MNKYMILMSFLLACLGSSLSGMTSENQKKMIIKNWLLTENKLDIFYF